MPRRDPVNGHDPFCRKANQLIIAATICSDCELIREIREDEITKQYWDNRWSREWEGMPE